VNQRVWHPLLFAFFPPLFLLSRNLDLFSPAAALRPTAIAVGGAGLATLAFRGVTGDRHKGGLVASAGVLLVFSHGHLVDVLLRAGFRPGNSLLSTPVAVGALMALALAFIAAHLRRARAELSPWTKVLNQTSAVLVALSLLKIAAAEGQLYLAQHSPPAAPSGGARQGGAPPPDIYYIVVDGYSRSDNLRNVYGFDDSPLLDELRRRGFFIAQKARSNYGFTQLSVPAALQMDYLVPGARTRGVVDHSRVRALLEPHGYRFVAFATGFLLTEMRSADVYLVPPVTANEFEAALLARLQVFGATERAEAERRRVLFPLAEMPRVAALPGPKFVFAHLICPHPPYLFSADGSPSGHTDILDVAGTGTLIRPGRLTRPESTRRYL
jgi:hypothetical protein